ncbi:MAG: type I methionyl aminopeptidase [Synechococcaceae cyanobacterium SM2_3_2]|nr:type I methionyl aminopeptidase [Synechococcaceae cyanobacterium SM2_3_2]
MKTIERKTPLALQRMRRAGAIVGQILSELAEQLRPGWTTADIDIYAAQRLEQSGATASFKGYQGFPATVCVSLNNEMAHGIPSPFRRIKPGDLVSVDLGACVEGWHGDACITVGMDPLASEHHILMEMAQGALWAGIHVIRAGIPLQTVSGVIEDYVQVRGGWIVPHYVGHGIGRNVHEDPVVPHVRLPQAPDPVLKAGMTLTLEPIVCTQKTRSEVLSDGWTVVSTKGIRSAQFEHTLLITETGCEILTPWQL